MKYEKIKNKIIEKIKKQIGSSLELQNWFQEVGVRGESEMR